MSTIHEGLDKIRTLLQSPEFLEGKGLSNEVNIRIFCYDPKEEMAVRHFTRQLEEEPPSACRLKIHNLYRIFLSICDEKRITRSIPGIEEKKGRDFLLEQMKRIAGNTAFVAKMKQETPEDTDALIITGVGEAYPFIRVHSLLEAMQPQFPDIPILVLYPGDYDGHAVRLFHLLEPNSYYRAFRLI